MNKIKIRASSLLAIFCLVVSGCGGVSHIPVSGTVTVDQAPMEGVTLSFFPEGGGTTASATTGPHGTFTVRTSDKEGCLPGTYTVTIAKYSQKPVAIPQNHKGTGPISNDNPILNLLPDKYAKKESSGLSAEVKSGMGPLSFEISTK